MTNAEHRHLRLLLAHYRELDDPARVAVDAHLLTCADCRLALAAYAEHEALLLRSLPARAISAPGRRPASPTDAASPGCALVSSPGQ
ncbi:zf-HC2 domain-containing protein [Candidatus Amarolinea dominans]|uniref:zf-HC2 domain-containing protein n=1 Tax=Candidatus Amarolinea dominans TaxID=3140696 RepID=UPI0031360AB6|nr:hypothetical protein [Anaerolineae bacterium]